MNASDQPREAGEAAHTDPRLTPVPAGPFSVDETRAFSGGWETAVRGADGRRLCTVIERDHMPKESGAVRAAFIASGLNARATLVTALKFQDTDIPYSRKLEKIYHALKAVGEEMPTLKEIHAMQTEDSSHASDQAKIKGLTEALAPFARMIQWANISDSDNDSDEFMSGAASAIHDICGKRETVLTVGDLRRAASALKESRP